jgi:hypothetical protein
MAADSPLPLDPLTDEEQRIAERIATADVRVHKFLGDSGRLIYVQFISVKPRAASGDAPSEPSGRYAEVLFHIDPDRGGVRALVDLTASQVADVVQLPEQSVAINQTDVELAARIALADAQVRKLLGDRADAFRVLTNPLTADNANSDYIEGLRTVGVAPDDPCTKHRCVILFFSSKNRYLLADQEILVDLTAKKTIVRPRNRSGSHHEEGGMR